MQNARNNKAYADQERQVLTKAVINAAALMELRATTIGQILGLSKSTVSRMGDGRYLLKKTNKEWELAALLTRLFRSLDAIMGGDKAAMRSWLAADNTALADAPKTLITNITGLTRTVDYVDAYRARV
jgi:DNA-binding XRE family transcriptional regulator